MKAADFLEEGGKSKLRSTGSSMFYRAVGRETKPAWGNRIVKDFYDLDYNVASTTFKLNENFKSSEDKHKHRIREDI